MRALQDGKMYLRQLDCTGTDSKKMIDAGVSYIPEDRMVTGLVPNLNAYENIILKSYRRMKGWYINWTSIRSYTNELIEQYEVKLSDPYYPVKLMSGGNLQKLLLAREIESNPSLIVAVYPMRGLDIGAAETIRKFLLAQRTHGKAILLISEELDELFELSDRIAVFHAGEIMGIVNPATTTIEVVGMMMAGKRMREGNG